MNTIRASTIAFLASSLLALLGTNAFAVMMATVVPASPRYLEPVYLRLDPGAMSYQYIYGAQVSMRGTEITVRYQYMPELADFTFDVMLGRFPEGTYTVNLVTATHTLKSSFTVGPPQVAALKVPAIDFSGLWWDPAESGWGMSVVQGATNQLFAAWFVYDAAGNPAWYTLQPGSWRWVGYLSTFAGPIYRTRGPYFGGTFDPSAVAASQVGTGELSFRDGNTAMFTYTIDGVRGVKRMQKQPIE